MVRLVNTLCVLMFSSKIMHKDWEFQLKNVQIWLNCRKIIATRLWLCLHLVTRYSSSMILLETNKSLLGSWVLWFQCLKTTVFFFWRPSASAWTWNINIAHQIIPKSIGQQMITDRKCFPMLTANDPDKKIKNGMDVGMEKTGNWAE